MVSGSGWQQGDTAVSQQIKAMETGSNTTDKPAVVGI
jgi:hypothetical protein